ncbi:MAG: hypothetical protein HY685_06040 [Chloroflexi bacterium]|nr:hypothetical protein [Chloroflexota bacterium]
MIIQFASSDREAAEDEALAAGIRLSEVVSLYSGSPLNPPRLNKLARVGFSEGIWEQHEYFYLSELDRLPQIKVNVMDFEKLLDWFACLQPGEAYHSELAARWYGMAVGATDPLDGYLAAWIGLESIGPVIDKRFHQNGPKAACKTCSNQPGKDRDRGSAGIEHVVRLVAPEILSSRSMSNLATIRHQIAHGRAPADELRNAASQLVPDLILVLGVAVLTGTRPQEYKPGSGKAALPRDYEMRPDARASLRSSIELANYRPYYDEWIPVERQFVDEYSRIEADGQYIWGAKRVRVKWKFPSPPPELLQEYIQFDRHGRQWTRMLGDGPEQPPPAPSGPWRTRPISDAWKRHLIGNGR